jgi:hypothetical protein
MARKKRINGINRYVVAFVVLLALLTGWFITHKSSTPNNKKIVTVGTAVPSRAAKDTNAPVDKSPTQSAGHRNIGTATDSNGQAKTTTDSNQWVSSASGVVTVKQPLANASLRDGDILSGSAKADKVHYRLSDNEVGVISQGDLNVVDGNFSGTLHFSSKGTGGRLSVFTTDAMGVEYNEVQINLSF